MTTKNRKPIVIITALFLLLLLPNCTAQNYEVQPIETAEPVLHKTTTPNLELINITPEPVQISGYEEIGPENFQMLDLITTYGIGEIIDIKVSPFEDKFAIYTVKGIHVYDIDSLSEIAFFDFKRNRYNVIGEVDLENALSFAPSGNEILFSMGQIIYMWNFENDRFGTYANTEIPDWTVSNIDYSPDGTRFVITTTGSYPAGDCLGINYALYTDIGDHLYNLSYCWGDIVSFYHFMDNGNFVILAGMWVYPEMFPFDITVIDPETGFVVATSQKYIYDMYETTVDPESEIVESMCAKDSTDVEETSETVIKGDSSLFPSIDEVKLWQAEIKNDPITKAINEKCGFNTDEEYPDYKVIATHQDSALIIFPYSDLPNRRDIQYIQVWDTDQCVVKQTIDFPYWKSFDVSPTGNFVATLSDNELVVWNLQTMEEQFEIKNIPDNRYVRNYKIDITGKKLVIQSSEKEDDQENWKYTLSILNLQNGEEIHKIKIDEGLGDIALTSNPEIMLSESYENNRLVNISTGETILRFSDPEYIVDNYRQGIWIIEQENENDRKLVLYKWQNGEKTISYSLPDYYVSNLVFINKGNFIEFALHDKKYSTKQLLIDLNTGKITAKANFTQGYESTDLQPGKTHSGTCYYNGVYFPGDCLLYKESVNFLITKNRNRYSGWNTITHEYYDEAGIWNDFNSDYESTPYFIIFLRENGILHVYGIKEE